jgi:hypothetical protein
MADQVRIEPKGNQFAVVLEYLGSIQEMDVRDTSKEAEDYALYLARTLKLDVYMQGNKIT